MSGLVSYDQARAALREARIVDDVKDILDKAEALRVYAHQRGDVEMEAWVAEIKLRASRRIGELSAELDKAPSGPGRGKKSLPNAGKPFKAAALKAAGISTSVADRCEKIASVPEKVFDEFIDKAKASGRQLTLSELYKKVVAARETKKRRDASRQAKPLLDGMELRIGDARAVLADVPDNSLPLILTDPPYGDGAEPLYEWLAQWSARVLIPGGSLICYTGQSRLDRDMRILSSSLRWWWLCIMPHDQSQRLPGKFVIAGFKPVLWYVKTFRRGRSLLPDILKSPARDKELHNWGQGEGGVSAVIEHLTEPGELIVDPFAGTARWGAIAAGMGRRWLGADIVQGGDTKIEAA